MGAGAPVPSAAAGGVVGGPPGRVGEDAVRGVQPGQLAGRVRRVLAQQQLAQDREGGLDHLGPGVGRHLEHPVGIGPAQDFAWSQVSPMPMSTARGGSSG